MGSNNNLQVQHLTIFELFSTSFKLALENQMIKDQIILATGSGILADFWVPHEIES